MKSSSSDGVFTDNPAIYKIERENKKNKLTKLDNRTVNYYTETQTVTCKLNSKEALEIGNEVNFTITNYEERQRVGENVDRLTIIKDSTKDTLDCSGDFINLLLSELDDNVFGIRIE